MTTDTIETANLKEIYKKVDKFVNNYVGKISLYDIEDSSEDDDRFNDEKTLEQKTEERLNKAFRNYLVSDLDYFKIFILLLLAPNGLTKYDIALYLMDGKYETKTDKNGNELSPEDQIKKNVNYIEKNVAHLGSLLYLFYPNERDALEIVTKRDKTRAKTIRYAFRNHDAARTKFSYLMDFQGEIQSSPAVTKKERDEIAEQCIEYILKDAEVNSDILEESASIAEIEKYAERYCDIPNKNFKNTLLILIKAIKNKTLCKLSYGFYYGKENADDAEDDNDCIFFLPLMIRDASAKTADYGLFLEDSYSDQDSLFKYLKMLDYDADYIVFGLTFSGSYKGENAEWYRSAQADRFPLNKISHISLEHNLTDQGLEISESNTVVNHPIYNLNPYRNLCGEDFYLLLPKEFYNKLPSDIRTACFNYQYETFGSPEDKAKEWIKSCYPLFCYGNTVQMWGPDDLEGFNLAYYDKNTEYSLVQCKNYVELLNRLNQAHIILPDSTLPRELVDRQHFMFIKSFIRKDFIASPHSVHQYEKRLNFYDRYDYIYQQLNLFEEESKNSDLYKDPVSQLNLKMMRNWLDDPKHWDFSVTPADEVNKESASDYEINKMRTYLSKFRYHNLEEMLYCKISPDIFCKAICYITFFDEDNLQVTARGIPLCVYHQDNEHYLIFWDYLIQFHRLEGKKRNDLTWENTKACIEFASKFISDYEQNTNALLDQNAKTNLLLETIPLHKVVGIQRQRMETTLLEIGVQHYLQNFVENELKLTTNPRIDDITKISRTYYVYFEKDEFYHFLYLPDSFTNVKAYSGYCELLEDKTNFIPENVRKGLDLIEDLLVARNSTQYVLRFKTYKRSDVIRFLHEHMGRVFYLDISELYDDPLGIKQELAKDYAQFHHIISESNEPAQ